jgi:hypothetical protein
VIRNHTAQNRGIELEAADANIHLSRLGTSAPAARPRIGGVFLSMQFHRIYVRLKSGGQAISNKLYTGSPPVRGTELHVPLITGRTLKVRIGLPVTKHNKSVGTVVTVYADEI